VKFGFAASGFALAVVLAMGKYKREGIISSFYHFFPYVCLFIWVLSCGSLYGGNMLLQ